MDTAPIKARAETNSQNDAGSGTDDTTYETSRRPLPFKTSAEKMLENCAMPPVIFSITATALCCSTLAVTNTGNDVTGIDETIALATNDDPVPLANARSAPDIAALVTTPPALI